MLTSIRGLTAASFLASTALFSTTALAAEDNAVEGEVLNVDITSKGALAIESQPADSLAVNGAVTGDAAMLTRSAMPVEQEVASSMGGESGLEVSGNVALVTDYRFRGVSFTDGDIALQGGIDLAHSSGFYVGTWASSMSGGTAFGELELDIYGGWSGDVADGISFDIGLLYYIYPTGDIPNVDTDYLEPYASISGDLGPVSATLGVAYAWDQNSLGNQDNLYIYTDFETAIPDTPISLTAHLGYTDGVFATKASGKSFDWGLGAAWAVTDSLSLGVNYVDTQGPSFEDSTDAGFFFTLGYSM